MSPRAFCRLVFVINAATIAVTTFGAVDLGRFALWELVPWSVVVFGITVSTRGALRIQARERRHNAYIAKFMMRYVTEALRQMEERPTRLLSRAEYEELTRELDDSTHWERQAGKWPNPWPWYGIGKDDDE